MSEADKKKAVEDLRKEMRDDPELKKRTSLCEKEFSRAEYECMTKAKSVKGLDACVKR
jgi:hypothetical protein